MHVCDSRHGAWRSWMYVYDSHHGVQRNWMYVYDGRHGAGRSWMHVCDSRHDVLKHACHSGSSHSHDVQRSLKHACHPGSCGSHHCAEKCLILVCQPGSSLCYLESVSVCGVIWEEDRCLPDLSESLGAFGLHPGRMQSHCAGGWLCAPHSSYSCLHSMAGTRYVDGLGPCADFLCHVRHCACGH